MCQIRPAQPEDLDTLAAMGAEFFACSPFAGLTTFEPPDARASLAAMSEQGSVLVATEAGVVIGGLAGVLTPLWFNHAAAVAVETGWWVDPEHRGGPAGVRLVKAFEAWARDRGAVLVSLSDLVVKGEAPAGGLIEKLGYTLTERSHAKVIYGASVLSC